MNDPLPNEELTTDHRRLAERFADEGVPLRAMARAFKQTTDAVRDAVQDGIAAGRIVQMPRDDWPIGVSRNDRTPGFIRANKLDDESLVFSCIRLFKITRLQASLLVVLINRNEVSKDTMHQIIESRRPPGKEETDPKMVDVVICHLRKRLLPFNLKINTLWACGYYMEPYHRRAILDMVNKYVGGQATQEDFIAAQGEGEIETEDAAA